MTLLERIRPYSMLRVDLGERWDCGCPFEGPHNENCALLDPYSMLNGGGWKTPPGAITPAADGRRETSPAGPPPLSTAETLRRRLGTRIWTWT
jgi:hypothetical protein